MCSNFWSFQFRRKINLTLWLNLEAKWKRCAIKPCQMKDTGFIDDQEIEQEWKDRWTNTIYYTESNKTTQRMSKVKMGRYFEQKSVIHRWNLPGI